MAQYKCTYCKIYVPSDEKTVHSTSDRHKLLQAHGAGDYSISVVETAFQGRMITYRVSGSSVLDPKLYLAEAQETVMKIIDAEMKILKRIKLNLEMCCTHVLTKDDEISRDLKSFSATNTVILNLTDFSLFYEDSLSQIVTKCEEMEEQGSGWTLEKIEYLNVNINKCNIIKAGKYMPLPKWVQDKKACVNVQNKDNNCFFWSVMSALYEPADNANRVTSYQHFDTVLKTDGIKRPVRIEGIKRFETLNKIKINVYGIEANETIVPMYVSRNTYDRHVNLLYHRNDDSEHYSWIRSLSRLISKQISKNEKRKFLCDSCLHSFAKKDKLDIHRRLGCGNAMPVLPKPNVDNNLKFKNVHNQLPVPFVIYADFECMLLPLEGNNLENKTQFTQEHKPYSYAYYVHCNYDDTLSKLVTYRGKDCVANFIDNLYADVEKIGKIIFEVVPISKDHRYARNSHCHICDKPLLPNEEISLDHCHFTGAIRGYTHKSCNLNYKTAGFIPVFFHNLSGYDSHIFIKELAKRGNKFECIALNKEKYISFSQKIRIPLGEKFENVAIRFLDSYKFMASSLEKLAENLSDDQFTVMRRYFPKREQMDLVKRKGVFPYEFIDSWEKLDDNTLPGKENFYSSLTQLHISDEDYDHAQEVWTSFGIKTLGEYSDLYLKTDVLLLVEVFESFRKVCFDAYKLDPCRYYTTPGLSWDAMLKKTGVNLELLTDYEMVQFLYNGVRGGISQVSKRYVKANNIFMQSEYDPTQDSNFVVYLDKNNLYGNAMSRYLPCGDFKWLTEDEIKTFNIEQQRADSGTGYILEVDLEYPQSLHDLHNDYPFCAEQKVPPRGKTKKLLLTLEPKKYYIIHYMNLKQCVKHGLSCCKIHRILSFRQSPWLKPYIDFNTNMRVMASNSFEKDFFKLMNNSIFGKTIENVAKRVNVLLLASWSEPTSTKKEKYGAERYITRPNFHSRKIFDENFVAIQMNKTTVKYNKPIYVGFCVLELSKHEMYDFHYTYMVPKYKKDVKLLYTDTDSFIYEIHTDNFYEDIRTDLSSTFDTSDLPVNNSYGLPLVNKKLLGFMKDESKGQIIAEFVGLRSKMYAYKFQKDTIIETNGKDKKETVKKNKGTPAAVVRKLMIEDYKKALKQDYTQYATSYLVCSDSHNVYTQSKKKKVLSSNDDKRYVCDDNINTMAWGHHNIPSLPTSSSGVLTPRRRRVAKKLPPT